MAKEMSVEIKMELENWEEKLKEMGEGKEVEEKRGNGNGGKDEGKGAVEEKKQKKKQKKKDDKKGKKKVDVRKKDDQEEKWRSTRTDKELSKVAKQSWALNFVQLKERFITKCGVTIPLVEMTKAGSYREKTAWGMQQLALKIAQAGGNTTTIVAIIRDNYPDTVDWPCNIVPWERTKDLPEKDHNLLFLALGKMDNWESSESVVKATKWERFQFCAKNIFEEPEFCHPSTSGMSSLNWSRVQAFLSINKPDAELPDQYCEHLNTEGLTEGKVKEYHTIYNKLCKCPRTMTAMHQYWLEFSNLPFNLRWLCGTSWTSRPNKLTHEGIQLLLHRCTSSKVFTEKHFRHALNILAAHHKMLEHISLEEANVWAKFSTLPVEEANLLECLKSVHRTWH